MTLDRRQFNNTLLAGTPLWAGALPPAPKLESWNKGSSLTLSKWDGYRDAAKVKFKRVTFRFINDPSAQVAALLAGDIDGMPRFGALPSIKQFQGDARFTAEMGSTSGKGILACDFKEKTRLWRDLQRQLAEDAVDVYSWNPALVAVFRQGWRGLWNSSPIFADDMAAISWASPTVKP